MTGRELSHDATDVTTTRARRAAPFVVSVLALTGGLALGLPGCASHTVPDHRWAPVPGYYGQTVRVVTVGLVETIEIDEGRPLNLQINVEDLRPGEAGFPHQLTVGRFSRWLGSGFARGQDYVRWTMTSSDPDPGKAVFEVSIGRGRTATE